jgi:hypothetical protein
MNEKVNKKDIFPWILCTGLLTGTLDAFFAIVINYKVPAKAIFKFIASGFFGAEAFNGGTKMIFYGLLFHYFFALSWTIIFFLGYPIFLKIVHSKFILIFITGVIIWLLMNFFFLPLSKTPAQHFHLFNVIENIVALILAFGLPITFIAGKFYGNLNS